MTTASSKADFKALARELAGESIVTKALARFLEQIFEEVHEQEIKPLLQRTNDLVAELRKLQDIIDTQADRILDLEASSVSRPHLSTPEK